MKVEARIFDIVTVFGFLVAIVYAVMTGTMTRDGVEPIGTVALILTGSLAFLVGSYFRFVARRIETRPEDNEEAEISDGAGELGFFSPGSYWPVALAAGAAAAGLGLAFFQIWLIVLSGIAVLIAIGGLVFEYHTGPSH
ncbi:cytochrome C oxidase subunit IV [Prauserella marina]|uniref:Cytochrome c oxidase polypeptide 4 n=1 Tax=Prauserella marina TaxID=530584 RepID=A0A222VMG7_9PSEU|nr:cytochrome c oxidase subunit 4 [Prauserella marina]ASR34911.1 cytochrome C oxidase subunit IV [Prauserella marina]PWV85381.1 cytochrome c oxidase subunit IV [Prauserella marina]SDC56161.1 Cytochrome c oxidase subunit IV [Prauserella marina]